MMNPIKPCMICGTVCSPTTYMEPPPTVAAVHQQLRDKHWMEVTRFETEQTKSLRRGKQGIARRDGPRLF